MQVVLQIDFLLVVWTNFDNFLFFPLACIANSLIIISFYNNKLISFYNNKLDCY